jgi:hypothetical protein
VKYFKRMLRILLLGPLAAGVMFFAWLQDDRQGVLDFWREEVWR